MRGRPRFGGAAAWRLVSVAGPLLLLAALAPGTAAWPGSDAAPTVLAAGLLYLASHALRALRLALLAAAALGVPIRTVILLHFHAAPVSFAVPFKLGELYRWQQLARLARDPVGAAVVLLLERSFDAVILLMALSLAIVRGAALPPGSAPLVLLLSCATLLGLFIVLLAPSCLEAMQAYVLRHHASSGALRLLRVTDAARLTTGGANAVVRRAGLTLFALSAVIWTLEGVVLTVLALALDPGARPPLEWLPALTLDSAAGSRALGGLYGLLGFWCLVLVWPVATALFLRRARLPPRRAEPVRALLPGAGPRRIRLGHKGRVA